MDFAEHLRKLYVSENRKVCYARFLRNGLCESYCYISKSRSDAQYLEVCQPLFIGQEMKMELEDQSFCWSLPLIAYTFTTPFLY